MLKRSFVVTPRGAHRPLTIVALLTVAALAACTGDDDPTLAEDDLADDEISPREASAGTLNAAKVSVQRLKQATEFADTRILITLSDSDSKKLANPQVVGAGDKDNPIVLRDDGVGGDEKAGDHVFTGLAFADVDALKARAAAEQKDGLKQNTVFVGREAVGVAAVAPFDIDGFLGGKLVPLPGIPALLFSLPASKRSLMITDPSVVRDLTRTYDPCTNTGAGLGPWSFGHLMTGLANQGATGINPADLAEDWAASWLTPQLPGSADALVPDRAAMQSVIDDWRTASGGGQLDLAKAPFRLLAIVNRIDLAKRGNGGGGYGGGLGGSFLDGGEARFVFGMVLPSGYNTGGFNTTGVLDAATNCHLTPFTVIFEYKIDKVGCLQTRSWAQQWKALETLPFGSAYRSALQAITDQFTAAGVSIPRANDSALGQLRTNDFLLDDPWQMRQHELPQPSGFLTPTQVADTTELNLNLSTFLGNFIANNLMVLPFPVDWAGASDVPSPAMFWDGDHAALDTVNGILAGPGNDENDSRQNFSLGACSGCHARETDTVFVHIDNRTPLGRTQEAILSEFILGEKVNPANNNAVTGNLHAVDDPSIAPRGGVLNPADPQHRRNFRDLERRQQDLNSAAAQSCFRLPILHPDLLEASLVQKKPLPADIFKGSEAVQKDKLPTLSIERLTLQPVVQVH